MAVFEKHRHLFLSAAVFALGFANRAACQPEFTAWGNMTGIRVEGMLIGFESSLCVIGSDLTQVTQSGKEKQRPVYKLEQDRQTVQTSFGGISFTETLEGGEGKAVLKVEAVSGADTVISGVFLCLDFPAGDFSDSKIEFIDSAASTIQPVPSFPGPRPQGSWRRFNRNAQASALGAAIHSGSNLIEVTVGERTEILVQRGNRFFGNAGNRICFGLMPGAVRKGQTAQKTFTFKASGPVDRQPVHLRLEASSPGRVFDGIGGNFRLQNPVLDPRVIDYCLENLNVAWARVEMPWSLWHPVEGVNPIDRARSGNIHPDVREAMRMAQRLAGKGIPVIVSAWRAPSWAVTGDTGLRQQGGQRGNPLNPEKMRSIIKSIGSYLLFLKEAYGVEASMFSFNESDLGINVRQTGREHSELIKTLGGHLASLGLGTKMLLGDNSDATTYEFTTPALEDMEARRHIGAVSFHSWRGCDDWTLSIWADIARELNAPLIVAEGSTDAAAHGYPDIFLQPAYALNEIDLYVRIAALCQPLSILQWQLTADYSVLAGDGIYSTRGALRPTQRFWNLRQFGSTPRGSFHLPVGCDKSDVHCAAFGDIANGIYSVHMINNGAGRQVVLSGFPDGVKQLRMFVTDRNRGMEEGSRAQVTDGKARFTLDPTCFTSLISVP
jgi:hypothetical protein